jgi:hypothetical protein
MLIIRNLELKRVFVDNDFRKTKFETTADVQIGNSYGSKAAVTLTDEQTAKAVDFIIGMIREGLTVEMEKPVEEPAPVAPAPVEAPPVAESFTDNLTDGEPY